MHEYRVFLSNSDGAFGNVRTIWMLDDQHAIQAARRALADVDAIDIWKSGERVALLTRARDGAAERTPAPLHA